ncbi:MerC domain-containing protein [Salinisphaera sp.]|uniref:MerC domain-containing protein n=1 Tax=Salinisphaera sp. TaxID=1914330 RepID=UPI0025DC6794|nr:MerC domain-containing protein [Salinisphaera sp.]|tara:strand:+ start:507 stop:977 length:471 start_codon:yes stop_codon:yes gene_type:complete
MTVGQGSSHNVTGKLDKAAVVLSGLCLVHCLALPVVVALFPVFGFTVVEHGTFHQLILIVVIPTTVVALGAGYRRHRRHVVPFFGTLGVLALVMAAFGAHALGADMLERATTVVGGLLIAVAHIQNFRYARAGHCPHHGHSHVQANSTASNTPPSP